MNMYPLMFILLNVHVCPLVVDVCSWHKYWCLSYWTFLSVPLWWMYVHGISTDVYLTERSCLSPCGGYMFMHRRTDMNVQEDKHQYLRHEHVSTTGGQTWTFCGINISTYAMNMTAPTTGRQTWTFLLNVHVCSPVVDTCSWRKYWCLSYRTFLSILL
jgi:hypothetical protein